VGNVFLEYDSITKNMRRGRVWLLLKDGWVITLPSVLHITSLARNSIHMNKMNNGGVQNIFEKDMCKMVRGAMVLLR
jgi:hypothetical protein